MVSVIGEGFLLRRQICRRNPFEMSIEKQDRLLPPHSVSALQPNFHLRDELQAPTQNPSQFL